MKHLNKILILIVILSASCVSLYASGANDSTWIKGNDFYSLGEYDQAIEYYNKIEKSGNVSWRLFYNMGNAHYKQNDFAKAILYYERALKLNPKGSDILNNLEIAKLNTLDKIESVPDLIITTFFKNIRDTFSSNMWAYLSLVSLALTGVLLLGFKFARGRKRRKFSFAGACLTLVLAISCMVFSANLRSIAISNDYAIITAPVTNIKSAPNSSGGNLFILHQGTKVEILESLGGWGRIELSDGRQGWMLNKDMEII